MYTYEKFKEAASFWSGDEHTMGDDVICFERGDGKSVAIPAHELWECCKNDRTCRKIYKKYINDKIPTDTNKMSLAQLREENSKLRKELGEYKKILE